MSKNIVFYHRGERRVRRVLRLFQQLLRFSGASASSVCSAVKSEDIPLVSSHISIYFPFSLLFHTL